MQSDDEKSTNNVLNLLKSKYSQKFDSIIEFAAGMGRITKNVFIKNFKLIDVLEPAAPLAKELEKLKNSEISEGKINKIYKSGGEVFEFERKYDMVFGEWFLENMTDLDVVKFLLKAKQGLNAKGRLFFKENLNSEDIIKDITPDAGQKIRQIRALRFLFDLCSFKTIIFKNSDNYPKNYKQVYEMVLEKNDDNDKN